MWTGVDVQSPDVCGQGDCDVRLSQHVQLQQAVEERDPVVVPYQRSFVQRSASGFYSAKLTAVDTNHCLKYRSFGPSLLNILVIEKKFNQ